MKTILKVELVLDPIDQAVMYSQDRSINWKGDLTDNMRELMDGSFKKFFYATVEEGVITLNAVAPNQDW